MIFQKNSELKYQVSKGWYQMSRSHSFLCFKQHSYFLILVMALHLDSMGFVHNLFGKRALIHLVWWHIILGAITPSKVLYPFSNSLRFHTIENTHKQTNRSTDKYLATLAYMIISVRVSKKSKCQLSSNSDGIIGIFKFLLYNIR